MEFAAFCGKNGEIARFLLHLCLIQGFWSPVALRNLAKFATENGSPDDE